LTATTLLDVDVPPALLSQGQYFSPNIFYTLKISVQISCRGKVKSSYLKLARLDEEGHCTCKPSWLACIVSYGTF